MPPTGKLAASEIHLLRAWARAGATYASERLIAETPMSPTLWSFQPIRRPSVPKTPLDHLSNNPIDRFIFQKQVERGLTPSMPADRVSMMRRITVDLTGLPPTPEDMSAFLADRSVGAYEKVVDRLLASSAYGERWARHWLDVVRFGESHGYEQNHLRYNAWPYRDWVIKAFNDNMPYDRFITAQLAGDVLSEADPSTNAGTGFLVAGIHDTVGIQEEEGTRQQRINDLEDIVSTTGAAFLGLTVGCARCHDHKFDPIPQSDFYRLAAVFAGVRHGERPLDPRPVRATDAKEIAQYRERIARLTTQINEIDGRGRLAVLAARGDRGARPPVAARWNQDEFTPLRARYVRFTILATKDNSEPCLDELQVFAPGSSDNLALASLGAKASASGLLPGFAIHQVAHLNDGRFGNEQSWISGLRGEGWAQIELPRETTIARVVWSRDGAEIPRFDDRIPSRYRLETSVDGKAWSTVSTEAGRQGSSDYIHPDALIKALSDTDREVRARTDAERKDLRARLERLESRRMAYLGQFSAPDPVYVLRRGDVMQRLELAAPGGLSKVSSLSPDILKDNAANEPERRLSLARWITDRANPLTARVMVNRVWQHHFGRGIVGTSSDFGRNGERPTHPELLDWLASDFAANGWQMKRLHKMIVMSYTYRQSAARGRKSAALAKKSRAQEPQAIDSSNLYLWRGPLRRMEAEAVRDAILQASGKLDPSMGGPGYLLYQYNVVNVAIFQPKEECGPETWRRGIYSHAARGIRDSLMGALDCPESSQRMPKRESTTTALQALSLLNGLFIQQQSQLFADRIAAERARVQSGNKLTVAGKTSSVAVDRGSKSWQVTRAFQIAFGRPPTPGEANDALALVSAEGLPALCRALMNANEFLYF